LRVDVAVVGAGPAGSWAAYELARRGTHVALVDGTHPREKPCGGGVTGRALAMVADATGGRFDAVPIRSVRFRDGASGESAVVRLDDGHEPRVIVASRRGFDGALRAAAQRAGAAAIDARATGLARDGHGWRVDLAQGATLFADAIVGADGANSLVRRRLLAPFRREQLSIGTGYFAQGVTSDEIVLELEGSPPGYLWSFPRTDHLAIGICAQADAADASALRARAAQWIARAALAPGARLQSYSWPIPSLSRRDLHHLRAGDGAWLLAGDAAGLVDPITREGIYFALRSSALAADALLSGARDPGAAYNSMLRDDIVPELAAAARLKAGFFRPRFTRLMMRALSESSDVRAVMADLVAGAQSYRTLKWRLLKTFELRFACELVAMQ